MGSLFHVPLQQEHPELLLSVSTSTVHANLVRLDPSRSYLSFATCRHSCLPRRRSICFYNRMEQFKMEKIEANGLVLLSSFMKLTYKAAFTNSISHTGRLGNVWAAPRSSEDYHVEKVSSMERNMSMQHDGIAKAGHQAMFPKDIQLTGKQGDMHGTVRTTDIPSEGCQMMEAQCGLATALYNSGLSQKDSDFVASKAPITVQALVNAALELDEFAIWIDQQSTKQQDLKQKVIELATTNVNRQLSAVLESIGVGQRHTSRVCHFLASQNVADVLLKIRALEAVFPNEKNEIIVMRTRRMMHEMSLSADGALQKTLSLFEKFLDGSKTWRDKHIEHTKGSPAPYH